MGGLNDSNKLNSTYFLGAIICLIFSCLVNASKSYGDVSLELYGGYQSSPHSIVTGNYNIINNSEPFEFTTGWVGKSFSMPPYYGIRLTNWFDHIGWGLEFTHSKAYADQETLTEIDFDRLEFSDGLNNLIFHRQHQLYDLKDNFLPYFGYGVGVVVPHVEFQRNESSPLTFEYQLGGPSISFNGGLKYHLMGNRFFFSEYRFTSSWLNLDLEGGGKIKTRLFTNALNMGFGYNF